MIIPVPVPISRRCARAFIRSLQDVLYKTFPKSSREIIFAREIRKSLEQLRKTLKLTAPVVHHSSIEQNYFEIDEPGYYLAVRYWVAKAGHGENAKFSLHLEYHLPIGLKYFKRRTKQRLSELALKFRAEVKELYFG
jgi:hypothetical protein